MATKFDTAVVTAAGKELLQKVQQGLTTMQFTGFGLGSGEWEEAEIATATALKSVKNTCPLCGDCFRVRRAANDKRASLV